MSVMLQSLNNIRTLRAMAREFSIDVLEEMLEKFRVVTKERREEEEQQQDGGIAEAIPQDGGYGGVAAQAQEKQAENAGPEGVVGDQPAIEHPQEDTDHLHPERGQRLRGGDKLETDHDCQGYQDVDHLDRSEIGQSLLCFQLRTHI